MKKEQYIAFGFVALLLLVIAGIVLGLKKSAAKKKRLSDIKERIKSNIGINGDDIDAFLYKVKPDANYKTSDKDADLLISHDGTLWDNEDKIFELLKGKTKAQLSKLNQSLLQRHGKSLQKFINDVFRQLADINMSGNYAQYEKAFNMIKNAS